MKKVMVMLAAVCIAFAGLADSTGATTNWVARYVAQAISNSQANVIANTSVSATTNGITTMQAGSGDFKLMATFEAATITCLTAENCTQAAVDAGITNGTRWADSGIQGFTRRDGSSIVRVENAYRCGAFIGGNSIESEFKKDGQTAFVTKSSFITQREAARIKGE